MSSYSLPPPLGAKKSSLSGAPVRDSLAKETGSRKKSILSRAHCCQLELSLHTDVYTRKQKSTWPPWPERLIFRYDCQNLYDVSKAHSASWVMNPFTGVDSDVFGEWRWVGYQHLHWKIRVCSPTLVNWKHWSGLGQPPQGPVVSPQGAKERASEAGGADCWKGWCLYTSPSKEKLDLPGNAKLWRLTMSHLCKMVYSLK